MQYTENANGDTVSYPFVLYKGARTNHVDNEGGGGLLKWLQWKKNLVDFTAFIEGLLWPIDAGIGRRRSLRKYRSQLSL